MPHARARANGEGTIFKLPNGKYRAEKVLGWDAIILPDGTQKKKKHVKTKSGFKLKRDAQTWLDAFKTANEINKEITFKDLYDLWSTAHYAKISKDMEYCYTSAYAKCKALYYRPFASLKTNDLQTVVDTCTLGYETKQKIRTLFSGMYGYAIQNDYCEKNYAQFVKLPPKPKSNKDAFTRDERDKLWADYNSGFGFTGYILLMIYTGMRYGEISIIERENIYLSEKYMIGGIKSDAGTNRIIPIADCILSIVQDLYNKTDKKILDIPSKTFYARYYETLLRLGIRGLKPHSCRHTCATALAEANVPPAIIQAILGHADYATTMQYTHVQNLPNMLNGINRLDKKVGVKSRSKSRSTLKKQG